MDDQDICRRTIDEQLHGSARPSRESQANHQAECTGGSSTHLTPSHLTNPTSVDMGHSGPMQLIH